MCERLPIMAEKPVRAESLLEIAKRPWLDVAPEINGSIVYLDAGAAEFVHVSLGAPFLFGEAT